MNRSLLFSLVVSDALLSAWGQFGAAGSQGPTSVIVGVLVDSADGSPVHPGRADIPAKQIRVFTDTTGRFVITGLALGRYQLYGTGVGYRSESVVFVLGPDTLRLPPMRLRPAKAPL